MSFDVEKNQRFIIVHKWSPFHCHCRLLKRNVSISINGVHFVVVFMCIYFARHTHLACDEFHFILSQLR